MLESGKWKTNLESPFEIQENIRPSKKKNKPWTPHLKSRKNVRTRKKKNKPWTPRLKSRRMLKPGKRKHTIDLSAD